MDLLLDRITENEKESFKNLIQLFAYDFSELIDMDVDDNGLYPALKDMDDYYTQPEYVSFFIRISGKLAGLAVIKFIKEENTSYLRHFFVMRKYRKLKVGQIASHMIFDSFPGKWRVSQFDFNEPAINFWRKVIERYTNCEYVEIRRADGRGPQQEFYSR